MANVIGFPVDPELLTNVRSNDPFAAQPSPYELTSFSPEWERTIESIYHCPWCGYRGTSCRGAGTAIPVRIDNDSHRLRR